MQLIDQVKGNYQLTNENLRDLIKEHDTLDRGTKEHIQVYIESNLVLQDMEKEFEDHAAGLGKHDELKDDEVYSPEDLEKYNYSNLLENIRADSQGKTPKSKAKSGQKTSVKAESAVKSPSPLKTVSKPPEAETDEDMRKSIRSKLMSVIDDY